MSARPLRIGVAGLGVVGASALRTLLGRADLLAARAGRSIAVVGVCARERTRDRGVDLSGVAWFDDATALAVAPDVDLFVELIGGSSGPALDACRAALQAGRGVVSANKAMLAEQGGDLAARAAETGAPLKFEAAVAGGVPAVKSVGEALAANRVTRVAGILNGTSNYILTQMQTTRCDFESALAQAQRLGYAEADPTIDVDGVDAAHKLALLAAIAFGRAPDFAGVAIDGVRGVDPVDEAHAAELGYRIKLLGVAECEGEGPGAPLRQRVGPCLIEASSPLGAVDGVLNGVVFDGDLVGRLHVEGPGAGGEATASAVLADIVDCAAGRVGAPFGVPAAALAAPRRADPDSLRRSWYLRVSARDEPGVVAHIAAALRDQDVSIASMIQRGRGAHGAAVPVAFILHDASLGAVKRATAQLGVASGVLGAPHLMPIEPVA